MSILFPGGMSSVNIPIEIYYIWMTGASFDHTFSVFRDVVAMIMRSVVV